MLSKDVEDRINKSITTGTNRLALKEWRHWVLYNTKQINTIRMGSELHARLRNAYTPERRLRILEDWLRSLPDAKDKEAD